MADSLTLEYEGRKYEIDIESITPREFKAIKTHTGLNMGRFLASWTDMNDLDADAVVALLWLCRTRAGETADWDEEFPVLKLMGSIGRAGGGDGDQEAPKAGS